MQNRPSAYNQVFDGSYLCSENKAQLVLFCNDCTIIDCLGHKKVNLFFTKKLYCMQKGKFTSNMIITCGMKSNQQYNFFEGKCLKMTALNHGLIIRKRRTSLLDLQYQMISERKT